jgi:hypothetical protein
MNREELLESIRRIIGNKKFTFSDDYIKQCGNTPTIGDDGRRYYAITKKYLFIVDCWGRYDYSAAEKEWGWYFMRYPVCYRVGSGQNINKVELEDMFTKDLQKLYDDIVFYLWWETNVNMPKLKKAYEECLKYKPMFDKIKISSEELEKITNQ